MVSIWLELISADDCWPRRHAVCTSKAVIHGIDELPAAAAAAGFTSRQFQLVARRVAYSCYLTATESSTHTHAAFTSSYGWCTPPSRAQYRLSVICCWIHTSSAAVATETSHRPQWTTLSRHAFNNASERNQLITSTYYRSMWICINLIGALMSSNSIKVIRVTAEIWLLWANGAGRCRAAGWSNCYFTS